VQEESAHHEAAIKTFTPEELAAMFPLFSGLTPEQREVLVLHFKPFTADPGERIIRAGDTADALYLISKGEVEVSVDGNRIGTMGPGQYFGEIALLSGGRRSADVTALDYSRFAKLTKHDFRRFLRKHPDIQAQFAATAAERAETKGQEVAEAADAAPA